MSYTWEPKWVKKKIKVSEGIEIETCYDISTGLMLCPLCVNVSRTCSSTTEPTNFILENVPYFFSPEDIVYHMKTHTKIIEGKKLYIEIEEEEEEVEEEE